MKTKSKKAFTLLELMVAAVLVGLLSAAIATLVAMGNKSYRIGLKRINNYEAASRLTSDFDRYSRGAVSIIEADPQRMTFMAYLKADLRPAPTKIGYLLQDGQLIRSVVYPVADGDTFKYPDENIISSVVARGIESCLFEYFEESNNLLTSPVVLGQIKMTKLSVSLDLDSENQPGPATISTLIQFRNLKTNL